MRNSLAMLFNILVLSLAISACQANRRAKLEESVQSFITAIRRQDTNRALSYVQADKQDQFFKESQKIDQIRVSQLEVQSIFPDEKLEKAFVSVVIEYFSPQTFNLSSAKRLYTWSYNKDAKAWYVEDSHPFGAEP